mgnify:CR=1 FL=1
MDKKLAFEKLNDLIINSSSKYYHYPVAAILECNNGLLFSGVNIETSSPQAGICAERCAIVKAISEGEKEILAVAIYSPNQDECYPCGACIQVMYEFQGDEDLKVITEQDGKLNIRKLSEFLPYGFKITE